jgi:hypothetical protein
MEPFFISLKKTKIMRTFIALIITLFAVIAWQSCQYDWVESEPVDPNDTIPVVTSFSADIMPIFNTGCNMSGCHAPGGFSPDLTLANAYADLWAENMIDTLVPENSVLYKKVAPGGSMNSFSKKNDYKTILSWIDQGALNN